MQRKNTIQYSTTFLYSLCCCTECHFGNRYDSYSSWVNNDVNRTYLFGKSEAEDRLIYIVVWVRDGRYNFIVHFRSFSVASETTAILRE